MIKNKEAMYWYESFFSRITLYYNVIFTSPGCRAIIQKASGCDWIQCTQCKIEICVSKILIICKISYCFFLFSGQRKVLVGVQKDMVIHQVVVDVVLIMANFVYQIVKIVTDNSFLFLFVF